MNKDKIEGAAKEVAGKVQKEFGKAVDSPKHTAEGATKEAAGKAQKTWGDAKDKAADAIRKM